MKKMLIAIDNIEIFNEINKQISTYDIHKTDIIYKEGVLEYIAKNDIDIVITRDDLDGDMTKEIYVKQIKLIKSHVRIVLFTKQIDEKYLTFLYSNEVFDVININEINVKEKILDILNKKIVLSTTSCKEIMPLEENRINVITKKKIAVFGTSGAGKSYVASILSNIISRYLNMKTFLVDLDVQSSAIDIYNNLNCCNNILMDIVKDVDNNAASSENFHNNVYKKNKIGFVTNNASIFEYQNSLCEKHYNKIFELASEKYDVIISDTPANVFLDIAYFNIKNADIIIFVINPNYISIRQAIKYLDLIVNVWNISREKIKLVINKNTNYSLSENQIKSMLPEYDVIMKIDYDQNVENIINGISSINLDKVTDYEKIYKIFGIKKVMHNKKVDSRKNKLLYSFFKKGELV